MDSRNIVLCGFMGCGKTSVGKRLASLAKRGFVDMDSYIEEQQGCTVADIFAQQGEEAFRRMEEQAAGELSAREGLVVATGGGAVLRPATAAALKRNGILLFLDVPLPVIYQRLKNDTKRPLLQRPDKEEAMKVLFEQRRPLYLAAADLVVEAGMSVPAAARCVLALLENGM